MKISRNGRWYRFVEHGLGVVCLPLSHHCANTVSLCQLFWGTVFSLLFPWFMSGVVFTLVGFLAWQKPLTMAMVVGGIISVVGVIIGLAEIYPKMKDGIVGETVYAVKKRVCPLIELTE